MNVRAIKTRRLNPPADDLLEVIDTAIESLSERSVVCISSKVVSIWRGLCIKASEVSDKDALIKREADEYLERDFVPGGFVMHTKKDGLIIPSAGIDASNADDHFILWPKDPFADAFEILTFLKKKFGLKELGVIVIDSHSIPFRRGTIGISLAHAGFSALQDYRGEGDLFGRTLSITQKNVADGLACAATVVMGEGSESTPLAVVENLDFVEFNPHDQKDGEFSSFSVPFDEDIYSPFFKNAPWKKGGLDK
ncbi:MAG: coenzyme F420-0:L-glutamate ligase [Candidatus Paceibacterota bacterium]